MAGLAIVTGSSRGIGRSIALRLAADGHDIAVTYRTRSDEADAVVAEVRSTGVRAEAFQLDLASRDSITGVFGQATDSLGPLRVLVNNAGILQQKPFESLSADEVRTMLQINLEGTLFCCQEALPRLQAEGSGSIVNVASSGGQVGGTLAVHYAASKAGVIGLTRSVARLGAPDIRVNCVSPGLIDTEMTAGEIASEDGKRKIVDIPLQRPGIAEEVAAAVAFLASDAASYITGQTLNVNGGLYMG